MPLQLFKILRQPFPAEHDLWLEVRTIAGVALFVFLFLYVFQPFGLDKYQDSKFVLCLGYGVITLGVGGIFNWGSYQVFNIKKDLPSWTFGKWIIHVMLLLVFIALGNYLFNWWMGFSTSFTFQELFSIIYITLLVGIFPVIFFGTITYFKNLRQYQKIAADLKPKIAVAKAVKLVQLKNASEQLELSIPEASILFIEAMQNYVTVHYDLPKGYTKKMLRNTLSDIEQQLSNTSIRRCHRSYLVNIQRIATVSGNAQGLRLQLNQADLDEIPVSRKYVTEFRTFLTA